MQTERRGISTNDPQRDGSGLAFLEQALPKDAEQSCLWIIIHSEYILVEGEMNNSTHFTYST